MKIELHFDEPIYRKQMALLYEMGYGKKRTYLKNSNYLGFAFVFIGVFIVLGKGNIGYLFILLGLISLISYYYFHFKLKKIAQKYEAEQSETIALYRENPIAVFEFTDEALRYSDYTGNVTVNWNDFVKYIIKDENVFLITKKFQPFILGKSEVGEENYSQILNFIKDKTSH